MRYQSAGELAQALAQALTAEDIAKLDQEAAEKKKRLATQPTEKMDEAALPERKSLPTVAMGEATRAQITGEPVAAQVPQPEPVMMDQPPEKTGIPVTPRKKIKSEKAAAPGWMNRLKSRPVLFIVIGVVLVGVLILVISSLSGGVSCSTVEDCVAQANPLRDQGDLTGYLAYIAAAIDRVPADRHPAYAGLWCDRGDVERQLRQVDEAIRSFTSCMDWTQGDPALQPMRDRAAMALEELR
jgi:hypothetical protein